MNLDHAHVSPLLTWQVSHRDVKNLPSKERVFMLTIERTKELLNRTDLTDHQVEDIRDAFKRLAEIVFEKWHEDQIKNLKTNKSL